MALRDLLISDKPDKYAILSGNEAIARGAIEAGARAATSYPGNPCTEILEALYLAADRHGIYVEWSINEKVALEVAAAFAVAGLRSLSIMKHVGLNWALDPLMCVNLSGVEAGMLVVVGDDPHSRASQNEEDTRFLASMSELMMLEPSSPAEAKEMVIWGFDSSERLKLPVFIRSVQRLSHSFEDVRLGEIKIREEIAQFRRDERFIVTGAGGRSLKLHRLLHEKQPIIMELMEESPFNKVIKRGDEKWGIITSGISYSIVMEALSLTHMSNEFAVLKLSGPHPLPKKLVKSFCEDLSKVVVVEEVEPYLQTSLKATLNTLGINCEVIGRDSIFPRPVGEVTFDEVISFINLVSRRKFPKLDVEEVRAEADVMPPSRPLTMCAGCPHRATFYTLRRAVNKTVKDNVIFCGDIGCYSFAAQPPFSLIDIKFSMGASLGLACGFAKTKTQDKVVALIGDSTFFHAGIQALLNAVYNDSRFLAVILDNQVIAMTGQQPSPSMGRNMKGEKTPPVLPEDVARALGVGFVEVVNPLNVKEAEKAFEKAIRYEGTGPAVVVSRSPCALFTLREARERGEKIHKYKVLEDACSGCGVCIKNFGCPAIVWGDNKKALINPEECTGCSVCLQICPSQAIVMEESAH